MGAGEDILVVLARIEAKVDALGAQLRASKPAPRVEDDGKDEDIAKDPPSWTKDGHPPVAPCSLSQGPADWLESVAKFCEWQAGKDDASGAVTDQGKPKSYFARRRAARARGWMTRIAPDKAPF